MDRGMVGILNKGTGKTRRERAKETITNLLQTVKFNPEGTCGPIWPEVVPLVLFNPWLYVKSMSSCCMKQLTCSWSFL